MVKTCGQQKYFRMRNYTEDQANELEALESIYYNELQVIDREPRIRFKITISTEEFQETEDGFQLDLLFTFPETYPDVGAVFEIEADNFEDDLLREKVSDYLAKTIEENLGSEMIFTLGKRLVVQSPRRYLMNDTF